MIYIRSRSRRNFSRFPRLANWERPSIDGSRSEAVEQAQVVDWINSHLPDICYSASAGGVKTDFGTAKKLKRIGYVAGLPDLLIFEARRGFHGLLIEMKREKNWKSTSEQIVFKTKLNERNYLCLTCPGYDSAIRGIESYFEGEVVYGEFEKAVKEQVDKNANG